MHFLYRLIAIFNLFFSTFYTLNVLASPNFLNLQSRITQPTGQYLEAATVNFRLTFTDVVGTCVLFQEDFNNVNMASSKGLVSLKIGSGSKTYPVGPMTIAELFTNFNSPVFNCQAGGTYTAAGADQRKLVMQFNDGSGWQTVPSIEINSVPFSLESLSSQKLGAFPAADYVRTAQFATCGGGEAVHFNGANFTCVSLAASTVAAGAGAVGSPSISFSGDADTGFYSSGANTVGVAAGGTNVFNISSGGIVSPTTGGGTMTTANGTAASPTFSFSGDADTGWFRPAADTLAASTGATERIRIDSAGNVGIGTTSPNYILEIESPTNAGLRLNSAETSKWDIYSNSSMDNNLVMIPTLGNGNLIVLAPSASIGKSVPVGVLDIGSTSGAVQTISRNDSTTTANDSIGKIQFWNNDSQLTTQNIYGDIEVQASQTISTNAAAGNMIFRTTGTTLGGAPIERMRIDSSGNVGIGTTTPTEKLDVVGNARINSTTSGATMLTLRSEVPDSSGPIMRIQKGRGDLTTTSPALSGDAMGTIDFWDPTAFKSSAAIKAFASENHSASSSAGFLSIWTTPNGSSVTAERMRIAESGNVGIGTISPTSKLQIERDYPMGPMADESTLQVKSTFSASGFGKKSVIDATADANQTVGQILSMIGVSSRLNSNNASALIGNGYGFYSAPTVTAGSFGNYYAYFVEDLTNGPVSLQYGLYVKPLTTGSTNYAIFTEGNTQSSFGGSVGIGVNEPASKLQVEGDITPGTTATRNLGSGLLRWNNIYLSNAPDVSSDARLKKDVQTSDLGLDFINSLRPVSWTWKDANQGTTQHYGVIAQETESAIAKAKGQDSSNVIVTHNEETDSYSVRYTELISPLIKAVQELYKKLMNVDRDIASIKTQKADQEALDIANSKIQNLEAQNNTFKQENAAMKARLDEIEKMLKSK